VRGEDPTLNELKKRYLRKTKDSKHCEELMEKDLNEDDNLRNEIRPLKEGCETAVRGIW